MDPINGELKSHPAAALFPLLVGTEFRELCLDIREHGQRDPIVVYEGQILDGRNRYRACQRLDVQPIIVEWDGNGTPEAFVISRNIRRRHLSASQRAMIISQFTTLKSGQHPRIIVENEAAQKRAPALTEGDAATIAGVARRTVQTARAVRVRGDRDIVAAVERGEKSVGAAYREVVKAADDKGRQSPPTKAPSKRKRTRANMSNHWRQLKDGLEALGTLPDAHDIVKSVPAGGRDLVSRRLDSTLTWLNDFKEKWNDYNQRRTDD